LTNATITENLLRVREQITKAAFAADRDPADIRLIAVSKTQPLAAVEAALAAGQIDFGENYAQEAVAKAEGISTPPGGPEPVWHFIGAIQSNKTRDLARCCDWIHTIDRLRIARRLNDHCPPEKQLNVCLQINVDADPNKGGISPDEAPALLAACSSLENLRLRGLMTILDPRTEPLAGYNRLRELFETLKDSAPKPWDTLSMGMSGDFEAAIHAGATHVRVGTAIFGPRRPRTAT
jgi:pyridoxal phosphate enzyme (YggS family)